MKRKLQPWQVMRLIFPEVLADYFEIVKCEEESSRLDFWMDERDFMEKDDYKKGTVRFWGARKRKSSRISRFVARLYICMCASAAGWTVRQVRHSAIVMTT